MKITGRLILFMFAVLAFSSCNDEISKGLEAFPVAFGSLNDIVIVSDEQIWEGEVGDSLRFYFGSSYPVMPAPEPIFDLRYFKAEDILNEPLRRQLRTYIIVADLSDTSSPTTKMVQQDLGEERFRRALEDPSFNSTVGRDKWARNQLLIYLFSNNSDNLSSSFRENFDAAAKRIYAHDKKQLAAKTYAGGFNRVIQNALLDKLGINAKIPHDYIQAVLSEEEQLMWIRKETKEASMSMVFQKFNYESENMLTEAFIKSAVNDFGKQYVTTDVKGAYLKINDWDLPTYVYNSPINDLYTLELRGIWETENDFMGGPYFSYGILSEDNKTMVLVTCFAFAPGEDKRNLMQQMELIANSVYF